VDRSYFYKMEVGWRKNPKFKASDLGDRHRLLGAYGALLDYLGEIRSRDGRVRIAGLDVPTDIWEARSWNGVKRVLEDLGRAGLVEIFDSQGQKIPQNQCTQDRFSGILRPRRKKHAKHISGEKSIPPIDPPHRATLALTILVRDWPVIQRAWIGKDTQAEVSGPSTPISLSLEDSTVRKEEAVGVRAAADGGAEGVDGGGGRAIERDRQSSDGGTQNDDGSTGLFQLQAPEYRPRSKKFRPQDTRHPECFPAGFPEWPREWYEERWNELTSAAVAFNFELAFGCTDGTYVRAPGFWSVVGWLAVRWHVIVQYSESRARRGRAPAYKATATTWWKRLVESLRDNPRDERAGRDLRAGILFTREFLSAKFREQQEHAALRALLLARGGR
jgi:hypothetical protein